MYNDFYGLKENPFSPTIDPRFFFKNQIFEEAIKYMNYMVESRQGFFEITGSGGCGKTLLCKIWMKQLPVSVKTLFFSHPEIAELDFLEEVGEKLGLVNKGNTYSEFIRYLNEYLLKLYKKGENVVFIFDDAQKIPLDLLEAIRLCSNLETEKEKLLQIVLVGSNELDVKLRQKHMRQLDQRIALRYQLTPLKKTELPDYIDMHLQLAGLEGEIIFTKSALRAIYNFSKGIPREINKLCDKILLLGYFFKTRKISAKLVDAAVKTTQGRFKQSPGLFFLSLSRSAVWVILFFLGVSIILSWRFQERIIGWTNKITPTLSVIKVSLLHRLFLPPVVPPPKKEPGQPATKDDGIKDSKKR
ncbi:MAG: AAA family ATPase [Candidatus Schekmanbacteria bacterium]|nr:AAA family ATPase [Candidatus Schekmanbacteria bacterium]